MSRRPKRRSGKQRGYAALLVALLSATVLMPTCAIGVDVARWHLEIEQVQKAADAAALAGVRLMPDLDKATAIADEVSADNGYTDGAGATVTVARVPSRMSQLQVTVSVPTHNTFGAVFGAGTTTISRTAVADYTAPAPIGSPCNTFGNEPPGTGTLGPRASVANPAAVCQTDKKFWGGIVGPGNAKQRGDRFMSDVCDASWESGCEGRSGDNPEYRPRGYFFTVHVEPAMVGSPVTLQIYDPAYIKTGNVCSDLPTATGGTATSRTTLKTDAGTFAGADNMNAYVTTNALDHWVDRYAEWKSAEGTAGTVTDAGAQKYCSGDTAPDSGLNPITTTWVLRGTNADHDPLGGATLCAQQFRGTNTAPTLQQLTRTNAAYDGQLTSLFHQWYAFCSFTPHEAGDYWLQVRTNRSIFTAGAVSNAGRTPWIYNCGTSGCGMASAAGDDGTSGGQNNFALRAVVATNTAVSVSAFESMAMGQWGDSPATFPLIRALPSTAGQYIAFDFFDVGDAGDRCGSSSNQCTITILPPLGSTVTTADMAGCVYSKYAGNPSSSDPGSAAAIEGQTVASCRVTITSKANNGTQGRILVPIPSDYDCGDATVLTNCWYRAQVSFSSTLGVNDFTTWTATIAGSPVRLVK